MADSSSNAVVNASSSRSAPSTSAAQSSAHALQPGINTEKDESMMPDASLRDSEADAKFISFTIKYQKLSLTCRLSEEDAVADLKAVLFSLTDVPTGRQKLLGLVKGALPSDQATLGSLAIPASSIKDKNGEGDRTVHFMLLGTPMEATFKDPSALAAVAADLADNTEDVDFSSAAARQFAIEPAKDPANHKKLDKIVKRFSNFSLRYHATVSSMNLGRERIFWFSIWTTPWRIPSAYSTLTASRWMLLAPVCMISWQQSTLTTTSSSGPRPAGAGLR